MKKKKIIPCTEIITQYNGLIHSTCKDEENKTIDTNLLFYEILELGSYKQNEINQLLTILNQIAGYKITYLNNEPVLIKVSSKVHHFKLAEVEYILENKETYYAEFSIKKKSGKLRKINAPTSWLKFLLRDLATLFYILRTPDKHSFGFELNRNIVENAKLHIGKKVVLNIDLKDFFPNINETQVKEIFTNAPFHLNNHLAELLTSLTTYKSKLPQGASTSPIISN